MNPTFHDITPPKIDTEPDVFDDFGNFWKDDVPKFQVDVFSGSMSRKLVCPAEFSLL